MFGVEILPCFLQRNLPRSRGISPRRKRQTLKLNLYHLVFVHLGICIGVTKGASFKSDVHRPDFSAVNPELYNLAQTGNDAQTGNRAQRAVHQRAEAQEKSETSYHLSFNSHDEPVPDAKAGVDEHSMSHKTEAASKNETTLVSENTMGGGVTNEPDTMADIDAITVGPEYDGPRLEDGKMSLQFMKHLVQYYKENKRLHQKYAFRILRKIRSYYRRQPALLDIKVPKNQNITICGDIHGQLYDLLNIFEINGWPSETNRYLFNGDFINRGRYGVESILILFGFKLLYPNRFYLNRGNHESKMMTHYFGFNDEVRFKYSQTMLDCFGEVLQWLPLAHRINGKVLVVHAGLFEKDDVTISDIKHIERNCEPVHNKLMFDLLWSDPKPTDGRSPNYMRGAGIEFGPDVTRAFCVRNGIDYIIRSHYPVPEGYQTEHNHRLVTVFSAPSYYRCNKGAILKLTPPKLEPQFITFSQTPDPTFDTEKIVEAQGNQVNDNQVMSEYHNSTEEAEEQIIPTRVSASSKYFP